MKHKLSIVGLIFALVSSALDAGPAVSMGQTQSGKDRNKKNFEQRQAIAALGSDVAIEYDSRGVPLSVRGRLANRLNEADPAEEAKSILNRFGAIFRRGRADDFTLRTIRKDRSGDTYVHMTQTYNGIPVIGGELVVHLGKREVSEISGRFIADLKVDTQPSLTKDYAIALVQSHIAEGEQQASVLDAGEPVIFVNETDVAHLAIPVQVDFGPVGTGQIEELFVDLKQGAILGNRLSDQKAQSDQSVTLAGDCSAWNRLVNPGFEAGAFSGWLVQSTEAAYTSCSIIPSGWFASNQDIIVMDPPTHNGSYKAWLGGWGRRRQDSITSQPINLAVDGTCGGTPRATLSLWLSMYTYEIPPTSRAAASGYDFLYVEILNTSGSVLETLAVINSFYMSGSYIYQTADLSRYLGSSIKIRFRSCENAERASGFFLDDLSVAISY